MKVQVDLGSDTIVITKAKPCCIKGCHQYATEHLCRLGMCTTHYGEMRD